MANFTWNSYFWSVFVQYLMTPIIHQISLHTMRLTVWLNIFVCTLILHLQDSHSILKHTGPHKQTIVFVIHNMAVEKACYILKANITHTVKGRKNKNGK